MEPTFEAFYEAFRGALRRGDREFVRAVYQDWVDTSGALPDELRDSFPELVLEEVGAVADLEPIAIETFGDFGVVRLPDPAEPETTTTLAFRQRDGRWSMFNERSGLAAFAKVYTLWYSVTGGRAALRFNGARHPSISEPTDDVASGVLSPLNSALVAGANTLRLVPVSGAPEVEVRIGSAAEGEIADSAEGDVLTWSGAVGDGVELPFEVD
jgi:hypothetical protein